MCCWLVERLFLDGFISNFQITIKTLIQLRNTSIIERTNNLILHFSNNIWYLLLLYTKKVFKSFRISSKKSCSTTNGNGRSLEYFLFAAFFYPSMSGINQNNSADPYKLLSHFRVMCEECIPLLQA